MDPTARLGTLLFAAAGLWAVFSGAESASFTVPLLLLGASVVLLWRDPGWWRSLAHGALAGLIAGVVVLAPGFRLAMRVVAIAEPTQWPAFSVQGTLLILFFVGCVIGLAAGAVTATFTTVWRVRSRAVWVVPVLLVMASIFLVRDLRSELFELGAGPWVNIGLFLVPAATYGWLATWLMSRLREGRTSR